MALESFKVLRFMPKKTDKSTLLHKPYYTQYTSLRLIVSTNGGFL